MVRRIIILLGIIATAAIASGCSSSHKRHTFIEPIAVDWDMADIPEPKEDPAPQYYDAFDRSFTQPIHRALDLPRYFRMIPNKPKQAYNFDAFGNVPNSSWFTNRNQRHAMTVDEIRRGPDRGDGPADGIWTVTRGKTQGVTPGFTIRDADGDIYLIKFDPPENPEMSTAAEIISTKLFWASGYNTPENYLVFFDVSRLQLDDRAKFVDPLGRKRIMNEVDLESMLQRVAQMPDGRYRAIASKFLGGKPVGPYSYLGTRKDDPNDIYPHEHRRDLRGLRVVAAWLQHNDIRRINSLDMYVTEDNRSFLRHYLIDFGATLGSASLFPNPQYEGHEYFFDWKNVSTSFITLNIKKRAWLNNPQPVYYPTVGRYGTQLFHPHGWKPNYPIPAFVTMTNMDAFWATKIVMSFTDEQIDAAVATGHLSNPDAAAYLAKTIKERRDMTGRYWFSQINPLDNFRFEGAGQTSLLQFDDLELAAAFEDRSRIRYRLQMFHNGCKKVQKLAAPQEVSGSAAIFGVSGVDFVQLAQARIASDAAGGDCDNYFYLEILTSRDPSDENWSEWIRLHLYYIEDEQGFRIEAVERHN